jgi:hypothetical protein
MSQSNQSTLGEGDEPPSNESTATVSSIRTSVPFGKQANRKATRDRRRIFYDNPVPDVNEFCTRSNEVLVFA